MQKIKEFFALLQLNS